ncbi:hypothetical protein C0Z19_21800 [Trinickia soli]|uniref:Uncharacterized protein n=1 Tax=Trinickia soli TaxID=380675 RepID=A0A2N7VQ25_9BURK|nr:hypothetical protein C0Z19_21800 [Trinickia soli]
MKLILAAALPLHMADAAPSSTEPVSTAGGNSTDNAGISAATTDAPNAAGGASSVAQKPEVTSAIDAAAGASAGEPGNAGAPDAASFSESGAASSALPASPSEDTAANQDPASTGSEAAADPHPASTHLDEIEAMVERMYYRAEQFAVHEWKAVINAARAVL